VTDADRYLRAVAQRVAAAWIDHTRPRALLLTGSAAAGGSDGHSDVDVVAYYDALPSPESLRTVRDALGAERFDGRKFWVGGVEVDVGAVTVADCERQLAELLERFEARSPGHRACEGLLKGVPLHGRELIEGWQARAGAYPPGLARAMVVSYLTFWPVWRVVEWVEQRDMALWYQQTLVDSAHGILGVLAGLNRLYFVPLYFKGLRRLVDRMAIAPPALADRLEGLFSTDRRAAVLDLERLVAETVGLVELHMPDVGTERVRRDLGARRPVWVPPAGGEPGL
jgi:hypothetical protein